MSETVAVEKPSYMVSAPITLGLDNLGRVQGGPFKQAFFTHFQPVFLIAVVAFYYYAPAAWIKPSVTLWVGLGAKFLMLGMEWVTHAPHHFVTQLNIQKGSIGNPVEIFLIGLGVGGLFDFLPRAALLAGAFGLAVSSYQHCNIRFNTPKWWFKVFNTTEHHSLHHAQDYESTRSNYSGTWIFIDRMHGTCRDGEAELLGQEGGRRMTIWETMHYTFSEPYKLLKEKFARRRPMVAMPAE